MADYQQDFSKLLSVSSSENRDSADSSNAEDNGRDEEFYEKIEAPKFVDFSIPDHYCPDDRYWFCHRVGCDQKHEEEMDSEEIYKNFVLRVMAARSPNVRLRKALDGNASRTPIKCPLSAPPKSSKPRLSRMAILSSLSKKFIDEKKPVVRPLLKNGSTTPVLKTKPVVSKYLTTPRNKKCVPNQNSFRSVQNPKPANIEVPKNRVVVKALAFHSPKKTVKVKTSVELRTPVSKLCKGMNKLEISSPSKINMSKPSKNMSSSSSRSQLSSSRTVKKGPEEDKSGKSIKSKTKGKLSSQQNDHGDSSKDNGSRDVKEQLAKIELQESSKEEACISSLVLPLTENADLASVDDLKREENCLEIVESNNSRAQATNREENNSTAGNINGSKRDNVNTNSSSEAGQNGHEFVDGDDKENAAAPDNNRMHNKIPKQNGRKIFGTHDKSSQVKKKVVQTHDKNLKEGPISSGTVTKLKTTNPKPFRLRTDERGILKEANLERRTDPLAAPIGGKLQRKQGNNDIQKESAPTVGIIKTPKRQERSKAAASVTPESDKQKPTGGFPLESSAIQRLEKFRKMNSPVKKLQGPVSGKKKMVTFLIPGKKLDVINETPPQNEKEAHPSCETGPITGTNIHNTPRSCIKKLK